MAARMNRPGEPAPPGRLLRPEVIGPPECPILYRWTLVGRRKEHDDESAHPPSFKLLLHRFLPNADDRAVHDHPRPFWTFVLLGQYDDLVPCSLCESRERGDVAVEYVANPKVDHDEVRYSQLLGCYQVRFADGMTALVPHVGWLHTVSAEPLDFDGEPEHRAIVRESALRLARRRCNWCLNGLVVGDRMTPGTLRYRPARHRHRTCVGPRGCWTLVLMGPLRQRWGFFHAGRKWPWREFERRFGFGMRCGDEDHEGASEV